MHSRNVPLKVFNSICFNISLLFLLSAYDNKFKLATHVGQVMFLSDTGFRFPLFHVPCIELSAPELYDLLWEAVGALMEVGITVSTSK